MRVHAILEGSVARLCCSGCDADRLRKRRRVKSEAVAALDSTRPTSSSTSRAWTSSTRAGVGVLVGLFKHARLRGRPCAFLRA